MPFSFSHFDGFLTFLSAADAKRGFSEIPPCFIKCMLLFYTYAFSENVSWYKNIGRYLYASYYYATTYLLFEGTFQTPPQI